MELIITKNSLSRIILAITDKDNFVNKISRKLNITYSNCSRTIQDLVELGLLNKCQEGRRMVIKLTEKGEKLKKLLLEIKSL